jgi:hypothetical protein
MVPLLIGTFWLLVVPLVLGLCAAARDGDLQQDPSRSAAVRAPTRPGCGTITRATHVEWAPTPWTTMESSSATPYPPPKSCVRSIEPTSFPRRRADPRRVKMGDDLGVVCRTLPSLWCL